MKLDRRAFLKLAGATGVVLGCPPWLRGAQASEPFTGPYWVTIDAGGGWDPTMLCDPKGKLTADAVSPINNFMVDDIVSVGPFQVAPVDGHQAFFERFRDQLLVINGIDAQTVSHETGNRHTWSGSTDPNVPALAALIAATSTPLPTLGFLSYGGYDRTAGLIAPTRIPDAGSITELAYPDRMSITDPDSLLYPQDTLDRLQMAQAQRLARLRQDADLPRVARAMDMLEKARSGDNELAELAVHLPEVIDNSANRLKGQAEMAMAAFKAGVTVSANLSIGGFDTHDNHDSSQADALAALLEGVAYVMDEAERQGIADKVIVLVGSEFGRTPYYNEDLGKDHWPITSMLLMGPGITGGRVIGGTDDEFLAKTVDPVTLALDPSGVHITPAHINASLRELAGIVDDPLVQPWNVGSSLPLLS
jgi:hypothetical protein